MRQSCTPDRVWKKYSLKVVTKVRFTDQSICPFRCMDVHYATRQIEAGHSPRGQSGAALYVTRSRHRAGILCAGTSYSTLPCSSEVNRGVRGNASKVTARTKVSCTRYFAVFEEQRRDRLVSGSPSPRRRMMQFRLRDGGDREELNPDPLSARAKPRALVASRHAGQSRKSKYGISSIDARQSSCISVVEVRNERLSVDGGGNRAGRHDSVSALLPVAVSDSFRCRRGRSPKDIWLGHKAADCREGPGCGRSRQTGRR